MKQIKWDNVKKEFYVVERLEDGELLVRPLTQEEKEQGGWN